MTVERDLVAETTLVHEALVPIALAALQKDRDSVRISADHYKDLESAFLNRQYSLSTNPFRTRVRIEDWRDVARPVRVMGGQIYHIQDRERGEYSVDIDNDLLKEALARQGEKRIEAREAKEAASWSDTIQETGW